MATTAASAGGITEFQQIYRGLPPETPLSARTAIGRFRISATQLGWKGNSPNPATGSADVVALLGSDIDQAHFSRVARGYGLRLKMRNSHIHKFDGFQREDYEKLSNVLKRNYGVDVLQREISVKGWNWGQAEFEGTQLIFNSGDGKQAFELPLSQVNNTNLATKNEVSIEFQTVNTAAVANAGGNQKKRINGFDELVEIRFYVPGTASAANKRSKPSAGTDEEEEEGEEGEDAAANDQNYPEQFYESIKERADLGQVSGEAIAHFTDTLCLVPRGRYDIEMYPEFLRLRGKTYDYKVKYDNISKVFLVEKPDELHIQLVIALLAPIRQGQTKYQILLMQFPRDEELELNLNIEPEELKANYGEKLQIHYNKATYEIVVEVFRGLTKHKVLGPDTRYSSAHGQKGVRCSIKASEGVLYLMEKYLLFTPKPPTLIPLQDVSHVSFSRVGDSATSSAAARTFDMTVRVKSVDHQFSGLDRAEYQALRDYMRGKNLQVKSELGDDDFGVGGGADDGDDDDADADNSKKRRARAAAAGSYQDDEDDEDESEDEDFNASSSDSDAGEEFDEEYQSSGGEE
ncbi:SSrecog-domain-containing protein [Ramicandelaber brevisporus]|nr:SSrecog-domain-containing protein [Ramicandelaber brevisporus]